MMLPVVFAIGLFVGAQLGLLVAALIGMARDKSADEFDDGGR